MKNLKTRGPPAWIFNPRSRLIGISSFNPFHFCQKTSVRSGGNLLLFARISHKSTMLVIGRRCVPRLRRLELPHTVLCAWLRSQSEFLDSSADSIVWKRSCDTVVWRTIIIVVFHTVFQIVMLAENNAQQDWMYLNEEVVYVLVSILCRCSSEHIYFWDNDLNYRRIFTTCMSLKIVFTTPSRKSMHDIVFKN